MDFAIYWTPIAKESFLEISKFLEINWDDYVVEIFENLIDQRFTQIVENPKNWHQ